MFNLKSEKLRTEEAAYLDGVDSIIRAPVPVTSQWLIVSFFTLFALVLIWAVFSKIDIVSSAQGKAIPSSRIQLIQAPQLAVIDSIYVREGVRVEKGQLLVKLEKGRLSSQQRDVQARQRQLEAKKMRITALILAAQKRKDPDYSIAPESIEQKLEYQLMRDNWAMHQSEWHSISMQMDSKAAAVKRIEADIARLHKLIPLSRKNHQRHQRLYKKGGITLDKVDVAREVLIDRESTSKVLSYQLNEGEADLSQAKHEVNAFTERFIHDLSIQLIEVEQELASINEQGIRVAVQLGEFILTAPVAGIVKDMAVNTEGGVVEPAQVLMQIVPENVPLEVEVKVLNRDIGFVYQGQQVTVKVDTFNFIKYGAITGTIKHLASDATEDEQLGPVYMALVELEQGSIQVGGRMAKLVPGMTMIVDMHVGQRRLIEYILNPVLRYQNEVMRER